MTLFHIDIRRGQPMRSDESCGKGFIISIEIFKLVIELWVGI